VEFEPGVPERRLRRMLVFLLVEILAHATDPVEHAVEEAA
jgi:hypothetical protein